MKAEERAKEIHSKIWERINSEKDAIAINIVLDEIAKALKQAESNAYERAAQHLINLEMDHAEVYAEAIRQLKDS